MGRGGEMCGGEPGSHVCLPGAPFVHIANSCPPFSLPGRPRLHDSPSPPSPSPCPDAHPPPVQRSWHT